MIFQQLGQLLRWTWGFNVLLAPPEAYEEEEAGRNSSLERGEYSDGEAEGLLQDSDDFHSDYESGSITPQTRPNYASSFSSSSSSSSNSISENQDAVSAPGILPTPTNGNIVTKGPGNLAGRSGDRQESIGHISTFPDPNLSPENEATPKGPAGWWMRFKRVVRQLFKFAGNGVCRASGKAFDSLPQSMQKVFAKAYSMTSWFLKGCWEFMNPPLWAMLVAILVASFPSVQHMFFDPGTFLSNSVTRAVSQSGGVAVPLILVVLGANLARNTLPKDDTHSMDDPKEERNILIASLVSRMLLPTIIMAPILALTAKYIPVSILDDPIFVIVCFLLTGAPSALQLSQICQINNVYMGAMSKLLFQSYVIWYVWKLIPQKC